MNRYCYFFLLLPLLCTSSGLAHSMANQRQAQPNISIVTSDSIRGEVASLRRDIDLANRYNDKILGTVYWALGVVCALALILLGFNWYTNFRIYDREKIAMLSELKSFSANEVSAFRAAMMEELNSKAKSIAESTTTHINSLVASSLSQVNTKLDQLNFQILDLNYSEQTHEYQYWEIRQVKGNMLSCAIRQLSIAIELKDEYRISNSTTKIIALLRDGASIASHEKPLAVTIWKNCLRSTHQILRL